MHLKKLRFEALACPDARIKTEGKAADAKFAESTGFGLLLWVFQLNNSSCFCWPVARRTRRTYRSRPFFLTEEEAATHGRKAWYDRIVEVDPGTARFVVAADYEQAPPKTIAVLPFTDLGDGEFVVDKISLPPRSDQERARWGWSHANRLRRAFAGDVATREFTLIPLLAIDAVLADKRRH